MKKSTMDDPKEITSVDKTALSRRKFIKVVGVFTISASTTHLFGCESPAKNTDTATPVTPSAPADPSASLGYIIVDSRKCQGCLTCMIACSLAQEGVVNLSKSRIQVAQSSFRPFPDDTCINQCHQCVDHPCVDACPTGALTIDEAHGNIRVVDQNVCVGCGMCYKACPFTPQRPSISPNPAFGGNKKSHKCDLCLNAPHHFYPEVGGGVEGIQTCVAVCPMKAIQFTTQLPALGGYDTNLRTKEWGDLGYSMS